MNIAKRCKGIIGAFQNSIRQSRDDRDCKEVLDTLMAGYNEAQSHYKHKRWEKILQLGVWYGLLDEEILDDYRRAR